MNQTNSAIIVDNDRVLLKMIKEGLMQEGYRCETFTSSKAALELVRETPFDIMVTDIVMPGLDGFELTENAKKLRPEMTVIIMTGFIDDFSYDRALDAGASDFIKKPFTLKEMKMKLRQLALQESLREASISDELTGVCNRKGFSVLTEQQLKLARRYKKGIFALYAVLDNVGDIEDASGIKEADQALIDTAGILKATFREADVIARIGRNEFVVVPAALEGDDVKMAEDLLQMNLDRYNVKKAGRELIVDYGIAYYDPDNPCSIEELVSQANKTARRKKAPGRA